MRFGAGEGKGGGGGSAEGRINPSGEEESGAENFEMGRLKSGAGS